MTKVILYIFVLSLMFYFGYISNSQTVRSIYFTDTLKVKSDSIFTKQIEDSLVSLIAENACLRKEVFNKPKIIVKTKIIKGEVITIYDTVYVDTSYVVQFSLNDKFIKIWGETRYKLYSKSDFDIHYRLLPRHLIIKSYFTDNLFHADVYENGIKLKVSNHTNYDEYYNYIESLKPTFWQKYGFWFGFVGGIGTCIAIEKTK